MLIYVIDDERIALKSACEAVEEAVPGARIKPFTRPLAALEEIKNDPEKPEVIFSDIRMPGLSGINLALQLKQYSPASKIIFITGYSDYAVEAFRVHVNGYLLKPVTSKRITEELEFWDSAAPSPAPAPLSVRCFGSFEVFCKGVPLSFKRRQTKELFAYLIDRSGAFCSAEEIAAVLWEDEPDLRKAKHRLRNLVQDLRAVLKTAGQEDALIRASGRLAVKRGAVDCDYYRMLDGDMTALNTYRGEYMAQYSWAQLTEASLHFLTDTNER